MLKLILNSYSIMIKKKNFIKFFTSTSSAKYTNTNKKNEVLKSVCLNLKISEIRNYSSHLPRPRFKKKNDKGKQTELLNKKQSLNKNKPRVTTMPILGPILFALI